MIDIKESALQNAAYKEALLSDVSIDVTLDRVLVLPIEDEDEKDTSGIIMLEDTKKAMKASSLMRGLVKATGPGKDKALDIQVGDVVYVYPNQFEATIALNGVGYLVYPERNIIAKDKSKYTAVSSLYQA